MLVSSSKKFIFIHVPKTAGTTVTVGLAPYCHAWASVDRTRGRIVRWFGERLASRLLVFNKHLKAEEARKLLPGSSFDSYFKFGFMRNPYDLLVSSYFYQSSNSSNMNHNRVRQMQDFETFVHSMPHTSSFQKDFICIDGKVVLDYVGNFNMLKSAVQVINDKCDLEIDVSNKANPSTHNHFSSYYNEALKRHVGDLYAEDIKLYERLFNTSASDF